MIESRKANPNASSSEMDPRFKTIKPFIQLTSQQHNELVEQFVEMVVDNMDTKTLVNYVFDDLREHYENSSSLELKDAVDQYDEELYDELVENVTTDDAVKEVEQCIIDTNGDYAECVDHLVESLEETKNV